MNIHLSRIEKRRIFYDYITNEVEIDICVVSETKFREGQGGRRMREVIDPKIFTWFGRDRRHQRSRGGEGGVGILFRNRFGKAVVAKVSRGYDIIWIKVGLGVETVYVGAAYMSPGSSPRETDKVAFLHELEADVVRFSSLGKVVVMGDFNSRIGDLPSAIFKNGNQIVFPRTTQDKKATKGALQQGRQLLASMNANKMLILNGLEGEGKNTFVSRNRGESMIDFIIMSYSMIDAEALFDEDMEGEEKLISGEKQQQLGSDFSGEVAYIRNSLKVWDEYTGAISDHRMVTCNIYVPKVENEKERKNERERRREDMPPTLNIPKWRRGRGGDPRWSKFQQEAKIAMAEWERNIRGEAQEWEQDKGRYGDHLNREFVSAVNSVALKTLGHIQNRKRKRKGRLVWNQELWQLTCAEKEAYDKWKTAGPIETDQARREYRVVTRIKRRKVRRVIRDVEEKVVKDVEDLKSSNPKLYWNRLKQMSVGNITKKQLPKGMKNSEGEMVTGTEMMGVWEESFQKLGIENKGGEQFDEKFRDRISKAVRSIEIRGCEEKEDFFTERMNRPLEIKEVTNAISKLKIGKAVGIDGITNEILRFGGEEVQQAVWRMMNEIWMKDEHLPTDWSKGMIFPIFKGGAAEWKYDPSRYRGITLLNTVGKLYASILNERIVTWCEAKQILAEEQAGFRRNRSTIDQLFVLHEVIKGRRPKQTFCCFIDIQKSIRQGMEGWSME